MVLRFSHILSSFVLACAALGAHAAELGEPRVASHIGQPLAADVELVMIEDTAAPVAVRLADPNVYRGANIAMPAVLGGLRMSVTRRDGRQFLHLTTDKPVDSRHLHVYLELADGGQRAVRLATLWLTPDPHPAPVPAAVPVPATASATAPVPQAAPVTVAALPAPTVRRHPRADARPAAKLEAARRQRVRPAAPLPAAAQAQADAHAGTHAGTHADAAACSAQQARVDACTALDAKNALLRQALGRLEHRVKGLQGLQTPGGHAAPPDAGAEPKEAPRIQLKPKKPAVPEAKAPWLAIGGAVAAVLALGAAVLVFLRRRRLRRSDQAMEPAAPVAPRKPGLVEALKARLGALRRQPQASAAPADAAAAEAPAVPE